MQKGYVRKMKVVVSNDSERVKMIREQLSKNDGYCPCRVLRNEDTKCICKEFRDAMEHGRAGKCHCGLYEIVIDD